MAIEKQIWVDVLKENFYPDRSFMNQAQDFTPFVEYNKINLAECGVDPDVLVDNTSFPIASATRADTALELALHTFDTKNTIVRNVEEMETAYAKMESVVRQHKNALQKKTGAYALANWAPAENKTLQPVKNTSGSKNSLSVKALTLQDVLDADAWFRSQDVDPASLVAILNPYHLADLQAEDMKMYKTILETGKLFGFQLYTNTQLPYYTVSTNKKVAFGTAPPTTTDKQASLFYSKDEVMKADGDIEVFAKYKDPGERGDVIGFQKRFTALQIRAKYQYAIVPTIVS